MEGDLGDQQVGNRLEMLHGLVVREITPLRECAVKEVRRNVSADGDDSDALSQNTLGQCKIAAVRVSKVELTIGLRFVDAGVSPASWLSKLPLAEFERAVRRTNSCRIRGRERRSRQAAHRSRRTTPKTCEKDPGRRWSPPEPLQMTAESRAL